MPVLAAAVALVGVLCLVDLVLSFGVIRRLRAHTEAINNLMATSSPKGLIAPVGQRIKAFTTVTDDGQTVSDSTLSGRTLVGFFLEDCAGCADGVPAFAAAAAYFPGGRDQVLAVIVVKSDEEKIAGYRAELAPTARVIVERKNGAVTTALDVVGYPAYGLLDQHGRVVATGPDLLRAKHVV